jgi:hypothetical protein
VRICQISQNAGISWGSGGAACPLLAKIQRLGYSEGVNEVLTLSAALCRVRLESLTY